MFNFTSYAAPETLNSALALLAEQPELQVVAGGTDILLKISEAKTATGGLMSIRGINALKGVLQLKDGRLVIGPLTSFAEIISDLAVNQNIPILSEAAMSLGGPQIRNVATIGGNICNGATSADSATSLFVLNARLKLSSLQEERILPINEFYLGPGKVDLRPGELLTEIIIQPEDFRGFYGHYLKFAPRRAMDIATIGVAALCKIREGEIFEEVRIALGVAGPVPLRCRSAEAYAVGRVANGQTLLEIGRLALQSARVRTSWRATKEFREQLIVELVQRALKETVRKSGGVEIV